MFLYIWHFRCFKCIIKNRENLKGSLLISDCQTSVRVSKLNIELLMRKIAECLNYLHLHLHVWQICIVGRFAASAPEGSRLSSSPRRGEVVCSQDHTKNAQNTDTLEDNQLITGHDGQQDVQTSSDENNEHLKRRRPQRQICLMVMTVKMFVCFHRLNFDFQKKCIIMSSN